MSFPHLSLSLPGGDAALPARPIEHQPAPPLVVATAGWAIPRAVADAFPAEGSGLARYAARFRGVEINTSFYRPHRPATYARWAESVPDEFRFAVKVPRAVTHEARLVEAGPALERVLAESAALGPKRGPLLVQLPPNLAFDAAVATRFLRTLRDLTDAPVACEPRHPTWFAPEPDALLAATQVARVAADPPRAPDDAADPDGLPRPGGSPGLVYHRLHGSPVVYRSAYPPAFLDALARRLAARAAETWCVFDNTASGAAAGDALRVLSRLHASEGTTGPLSREGEGSG